MPESRIYRVRIKQAFEYLEHQVNKGTIRYYGVSSNTLPSSPYQVSTTDIRVLLQIASDVSSNHHFRLIQFPLNYYEQGACKVQYGNESLLSLAKKNKILTFSNRPFNAHIPEGTFRLVRKRPSKDSATTIKGNQLDTHFDAFKEMVQYRLKQLGRNEEFSDFAILRFLEDNWKKLQLTTQHESIFRNDVFPFVNLLYENRLPLSQLELVSNFYEKSRIATLHNISKNLHYIHKDISNKLGKNTDVSLTSLLCEFYLNLGVGHVLVGMRAKEYVNDLKDILQ